MIDYSFNNTFTDFEHMDLKTFEVYIKHQPHSLPTKKPNALKIPVCQIDINGHGATVVNKLLDYFESYPGISQILRTPSGGISTKGMVIFPKYDVKVSSTCLEITALMGYGMFRFQFRSIGGEKLGTMYGRQAFKIFKKLCTKHMVDLEKYKIPNGEDVKKEIQKAIIDMVDESLYDKVIGNVNHLDVHSAWAAFACKEFPEFKPVFQELYEKRKINPKNKLVIVESLGMMQSVPMTGASWSQISKAGINGTNKYMIDMAKRLIEAGRIPILFNTDGIWYQGEPYHGDGEGPDMGQWSNDFEDVIIRIKGRRAYEYIEKNGKYHIVLSGLTYLDRVKPREEWQWGDLYNRDCRVITFHWDENLRRIVFTNE